MLYLGNFDANQAIYFAWNTSGMDGQSITRSSDGTISVYKDASNGAAFDTTQVTTGVTNDEDFDSIVGVHTCCITTTDAWYETGHDYMVVLSASTIDTQTVNVVLAHFSIENRFMRGTDSAALATGVNVTQLGGVVQSLTDLKDFADSGYNPLSHMARSDLRYITGLSQAATDLGDFADNGYDPVAHTITGCKVNDDMVGTDNAALATALVTHDGKLDTVDANVDSILVDTGTTIPGTITTIDTNVDSILVDTGTTLPARLTGIEGAGFLTATDSIEAIRNQGDAAWITGVVSTPTILQNTTIATLANQTSFTLTAGSVDDNAYKGAIIVVEDSATATQKAVGRISAYTGGTKTITLQEDPAVFTMAVGDTVDVIADDKMFIDYTTAKAAFLDHSIATVDTVVDGIQTDLSNATDGLGALKTGIDAIPTTAMRGTDSAALATGVDVTSIHGSALTETVGGYLAAGFTKLFDVATPVLVASEVMRGTDGANTTTPDAAGVAPTSAEIRTEMEGAGTKLTLTLEDTADLQGNQAAWATATTTALNTQGKLDVNVEVDTALADIKLDHLLNIAVDTNWATTVHLDSVIGHIADVGTAATFTRTTDALEAIRNRGDAEWTTATTTALNAQGKLDVNAECDTALSDYGANTVVPDISGTAATLHGVTDGLVTTIDTVVDTILVDTNDLQTNQGDWLTATSVTVSDKTGFSLSAAGVDAILDEVIEGTHTLRQYMRTFAAVLIGKCSGGGTDTIVYKDVSDIKDRVTSTVTKDGNRTNVVLDES